MSPSPLRATTMEESESGTEVPEESTMVLITMPGMLRMQPMRVDWTPQATGGVLGGVGGGDEACGGEAGGWREVENGCGEGVGEGGVGGGGGGEGGRGARCVWCVQSRAGGAAAGAAAAHVMRMQIQATDMP